MRVEGESRTSSTAKAKAAVAFEAGDGPLSPESDLTDLTDHLVSLGHYLKGANFTGKTSGTGPKRDPRKQLQGPGPSAAGPFHNKPPVQCYKCNGWGHYQHQCPNRTKVTFLVERENDNGEETTEGGSTPPRDMINPPQWIRKGRGHGGGISKGPQYHNPDPIARLIGPTNEAEIILEGICIPALVDTGANMTCINQWLASALKFSI